MRKEIEAKEKIIDTKIKLMEEASHLDFDKITLEHLPEATLYLSRNIENISDEEFVEVFSDFIDELYVLQLDTGYPIGAITKREQLLKGEFNNYSHLYIEQSSPKKDSLIFKQLQVIILSVIILVMKKQYKTHISVSSLRWNV